MHLSHKLLVIFLALWIPSVFISVSIIALLHVLLLVVFFLSRTTWGTVRDLPVSAWALGAFAICCLLSSLFNLDVLVDVSKNLARCKYPLSGLVAFFLFKPFLKNLAEDMRTLLLKVCLGAVSVVNLCNICFYFIKHQDRLRGFTDTLRFGYGMGLVLVVLTVAGGTFYTHKDKLVRLIHMLALGSGFVALILAATRGAILGLLCALIVLGLFSKQRWSRVVALVAAIVACLLTAIYLLAPPSWDHKLIGTRHRLSDGVRFGQWRAAMDVIKERPAFGYGPANVTPQLDRLKQEEHRAFEAYSGHSHNVFLEVAAGTGLLGLSAYLIWLLSWAWESLKAGGLKRNISIASIVYLLVAGQFEVILDANNATLVFILYALVSAYPAIERRMVLNLPRLRMNSVTTAAIFFLLIGTFTSVTIQGAFQLLFTIPLIYYVWLAKGRSFRLPPSAWWLMAFAVVAIVSIGWSWGDMVNHGKNLGRVKYYLFGIFGIFALGVWIRSVSHRTLLRLGKWFAAAIIISGGWNIIQVVFLGADRANPLTETMRYAYGTTLVCVMMLSLLLHRRQTQSWISFPWLASGFVFALIGMYFTNSRGAQAAFLLALPLVFWFKDKKWGAVCGVVMACLFGFFAFNYFVSGKTQASHRLLESKENASDQIRRSQWQAALIAIQERPVLGWGLGNFHSQLKRIKEENNLAHKEYNDAHAHNVLLEIGAGTGVVGLALFIAWFLRWGWELWQAGGLVRAVFIPFLLAIAFEAQFEVILDANNATMIFFCYALSQALNRRWQMPFG